MALINKIEQLLQSNGLWESDFTIKPNRNIRGQSTSYFIYNSSGKPLYIAKFFDYFKNISIPESIDISSCSYPDDVIDMLAEADDFPGDIDTASDLFYYQKRAFLRYIQVCSEEDTGFPKVLAINKNVIVKSHFYGLLIEEVIDGITLEEYLQKSLSDEEKVNFSINFLFKMSFIINKFVKHGIVHRDLSPDNIMFCNGEIIVIDPGMVKLVNRNSTEFGYIMGKYAYASPEQYYGYAVHANFTSDLYSIGLIAFEIITGINPLQMYRDKGSLNPHEEIMSKFNRELEDIFFANIDDTAQNQQLYLIIRKLLQVEKTFRFDDIASFQEALNTLKEEL